MPRRVATFVPPLLVGLLALPFILRQNSWWEWNNAYWLLERQTEHVKVHGLPTLFVHHDPFGAFDPFFVYYAGFTFSVLAYPAALVGAWPVFVASIVLAMVSGYLGIWWAARNLGLSARLAVLPGLVFATAPYVLSEIYGRGAWAELVAANAVAVMLGAITALLWHPERRRAPAYAALVASTAVVCGTHNLSLLMSAVVLPLIVLCLLPLRPTDRGPLGPEILRAGAAAALGAGLTAAWLIPNLWFGPQTLIAQASINDREFSNTGGQLEISNVLSPWPSVGDYKSRWIYNQPPVTAMAWAALAFVLIFALRRGDVRRTARSAAGLTGLAIGLLALITHPLWWLHFPRLVRAVQYPNRLLPYVAMVAAMAVVLGLTALRGPARRWMTGALVVVVAVQAATGVGIVVNSEASAVLPGGSLDHTQLRADREPPSFSGESQMVQIQFRVAGDPTGALPVQEPVPLKWDGNPLTADTGRLVGVGQIGNTLPIPVMWSPFARVTGDARIAGRNDSGMSVLEVTRTDSGERWQATVQAAHPWQLVVGRVISALSALALAFIAAIALSHRARRRRDERRAAPDAPAPTPPATIGV